MTHDGNECNHTVCLGGTGETGRVGPKGYRGPIGDTGATGATGLQVRAISRRSVGLPGCPGKFAEHLHQYLTRNVRADIVCGRPSRCPVSQVPTVQ